MYFTIPGLRDGYVWGSLIRILWVRIWGWRWSWCLGGWGIIRRVGVGRRWGIWGGGEGFGVGLFRLTLIKALWEHTFKVYHSALLLSFLNRVINFWLFFGNLRVPSYRLYGIFCFFAQGGKGWYNKFIFRELGHFWKTGVKESDVYVFIDVIW